MADDSGMNLTVYAGGHPCRKMPSRYSLDKIRCINDTNACVVQEILMDQLKFEME